MFLTINVKNRLYIFQVLFQMNKRFSKYSSTLVNVLLYVNFIYLIQVPYPFTPLQNALTHKTYLSLFIIHLPFTSFWLSKTRINMSPKTITRMPFFQWKPHAYCFYLNNVFPTISESLLLSLHLSLFTHSAFIFIFIIISIQVQVQLFYFFLPANSLSTKKWFIYVIIHLTGSRKTALRR